MFCYIIVRIVFGILYKFTSFPIKNGITLVCTDPVGIDYINNNILSMIVFEDF